MMTRTNIMAPSSQSPVELRSPFAAAVRQRRHELGLTQEELAWRAGLHRTYLANVESATRNLSLRSIGKLARGLELSLADFFARLENSAPVRPADSELSGEKPVDILLVEDNRDDVELALRSFAEARLANRVQVAEDGAMALEYLLPTRRRASPASSRPQLILLDLGLPKVSGLVVLERIRSDPHLREIPVIVLCSSKKEKEVEECRRFGVEHFLPKPIDFRRLSEFAGPLDLNWMLVKRSRN